MHLAIVSHFKPEFTEETVQFCEYFQKQLRLPNSNTHFYNANSFDEGISIQNFLKGIAKINEPIVIYYGGHGYRKGWHLHDNYKIPYSVIVDALKSHKKPIIFVNDCCFGMALQDYFGVLKCLYLLLGLSPKTLEGFGSVMVDKIVHCWRHSKPADPKLWVYGRQSLSKFVLEKCASRLRCGENLDYICYPKK